MTSTDYLDAVERRYLGDARFVSALVLSPRPGAYVGVARVLGGEELHRTATHAYAVDAARELARLCGASKHHGDAGVTADVERFDGWVVWHMRFPTGYTSAGDALTALRRALGHTRCALANRARLREMHAAAACVCGGDDDAGHSWACERKWCERVRLNGGVAWRVAGLVREAVGR